jgi:maleate isomerase
MQHSSTIEAHNLRSMIGRLSEKTILLPNVNTAPMPATAASGMICNGQRVEGFGDIDGSRGYPDVLSYKRKFGLVIPATNTSMEHELWGIVFNNQGPDGLRGVGLHTVTVATPKPQLQTEADLLEYKRQFLGGLKSAVDQALLAQPEYLIMGMSLEHIIRGLDAVREPMLDIEKYSGLSWATWHDAAHHALKKVGAKRIGLLTAFDKLGNENATRMFEDLGYEVVASVGFACANALHIAHVPDWAKEKAIMELLATSENKLDAIVQCGTNMSLINVCERLEPVIGIPILGINAVTFWYALRETGFNQPLFGAGKLLREF